MSFRAQEWAYAQRGLTGPEHAVLNNLAWHHNGKTGQCNPSSRLIAEETGYKQGTVNKMLVSLKGRGLIDEVQDPRLGRVFTLAITAPAEQVSAPIEQPHIEQEETKKPKGSNWDWKKREPAPVTDGGRARAEKRAAEHKREIEPTVRLSAEERAAIAERALNLFHRPQSHLASNAEIGSAVDIGIGLRLAGHNTGNLRENHIEGFQLLGRNVSGGILADDGL